MLDKEPKRSRAETKECIHQLIHGPRPPFEGPLLVSDIPLENTNNSNSSNNSNNDDKNNEGVIMGIDEAGRGPVLGPMIYAAAYWYESTTDAMLPKGYHDSKQMTPESRHTLFEATLQEPKIGFVIRVLHATEISHNMLRPTPYNLNAMSHDAAMQMISSVLDAGVTIRRCYVDTVGREETYKTRLDQVFAGHGIEFIVEKKADAKYKPCSAASVLAKVLRDRIIEHWKFTEPHLYSDTETNGPDVDFGSGYPSDPKCKAWMLRNLNDKVFCFPDLVRFSWGPVKNVCKEKGHVMKWKADEDNDDTDAQEGAMTAFITHKTNHHKKPRLAYFQTRTLQRVTKLSLK